MYYWATLAEPRFAVGDFVRRKDAERPRMRINTLADRIAVCSWWDENGRQEVAVNVSELTPWAEEDLT